MTAPQTKNAGLLSKAHLVYFHRVIFELKFLSNQSGVRNCWLRWLAFHLCGTLTVSFE